jgi:hypothetical protein
MVHFPDADCVVERDQLAATASILHRGRLDAVRREGIVFNGLDRERQRV